ncbi:MAG: aldo/keto reductase [Vampirovibrionales bacterium]|nr:aldo/keto reductase [Vampirovibrionales bacterium]
MKLALGTAQFGMPYGVSNAQGQPSLDDIVAILRVAAQANVRTLDTAPAYGVSESALGDAMRCLSNGPGCADFDCITKTPRFARARLDADDARTLRAAFETSLARLGVSQVGALLIHHADDLLTPGGECLFEEMLAIKAAGLARKIGVSVYTRAQIERVTDAFAIDLIQLPLNVMDQRLLADDFLKGLNSQGIELHARSIFLQGALLMPPEALPDYFTPWRSSLRAYHAAIQAQGLSPLAGALGFVQGVGAIDRIVCGVAAASQLLEILAAYRDSARVSHGLDYAAFAVNDDALVNPAHWPRF